MPSWRGYGRSQSPVTSSAVCGALRNGLSSIDHSPASIAADLVADRDHRVAEAVELAEVLALGRLDHQRAGHREAHRRCVEAVVDQPLRHVVDRHTARAGDRTQVDDALVGDPAVGAGVEHRVVVGEPGGDVVGRRDRDVRRPCQTDRRPSARGTPTGSAGCRPTRTGPPPPGRPVLARPPADHPEGTRRDGPGRRSGRHPGRLLRAGCRTSCAGSNG